MSTLCMPFTGIFTTDARDAWLYLITAYCPGLGVYTRLHNNNIPNYLVSRVLEKGFIIILIKFKFHIANALKLYFSFFYW